MRRLIEAGLVVDGAGEDFEERRVFDRAARSEGALHSGVAVGYRRGEVIPMLHRLFFCA